MKLSKYHFISCLLPAALGAQSVVPVDPNCCGNTPEGEMLVIRDSSSAAAVNARRQAAQESYQRASVNRPAEEVEIKASREGFLEGSEFLVGAFGFAILPKGSSVLQGQRLHVAAEPPVGGVPLLSWADFVTRHRAVVRSIPVTEATLKGDSAGLKKLAATIKASQSSEATYVTTFSGNPISVPAPKKEVASK